MRTNIISFVIILILGYFLALIGPWWLPLLASFVVCAWTGRTGTAGFWLGALGMVVLWLGMALWLDAGDVTGLTSKMASLFTGSIPALASLPGSGPVYLILFVISFLLGGLAGYVGTMLRKLI